VLGAEGEMEVVEERADRGGLVLHRLGGGAGHRFVRVAC
jgi:hypothetical protein